METPYAILLSAIMGALVAFFTVRHQWRIASVRATLQFAIEREVHDEFWSRVRQEAEVLLEAPGRDEKYWIGQIKTRGADVATIRAFLNHYELVATGIRHEIINGPFYAEWSRTVLVKNWNISKNFVAAVRTITKRDVALREFQNLAEKWERELEQPNA